MSLQKITYTGTECHNYLYFAFEAEYFKTEKITTELNINPTTVKLKQNPIPVSTTWKYQIDVGNEIDLETPLNKLIDVFESKMDVINKLKDKYGLETILQFVMDIDIHPEASTPYFGLNKRVINFLHQTGTEVHFDLYKADTIGLLENYE